MNFEVSRRATITILVAGEWVTADGEMTASWSPEAPAVVSFHMVVMSRKSPTWTVPFELFDREPVAAIQPGEGVAVVQNQLTKPWNHDIMTQDDSGHQAQWHIPRELVHEAKVHAKIVMEDRDLVEVSAEMIVDGLSAYLAEH